MTFAPHPSSTLAALLRLGAAWMVVILLVQGTAAAVALGAGPSHHHQDVAASSTMLVHGHWHDEADRHHHPPGDRSVVADGHDALDLGTAQTALAWAFALLAVAIGWRGRDLCRHVRPATALWSATTRVVVPLWRPPRG